MLGECWVWRFLSVPLSRASSSTTSSSSESSWRRCLKLWEAKMWVSILAVVVVNVLLCRLTHSSHSWLPAQCGGERLPQGAAEQAQQRHGWPQPHLCCQVGLFMSGGQVCYHNFRVCLSKRCFFVLGVVSSPRLKTMSGRWETSLPRSKVRPSRPMAVWSRRLTMSCSPSWTS